MTQIAASTFAVTVAEVLAPTSDFARALAEQTVEKIANAKQGGVKGAAESKSDIFHVSPFAIEPKPGFNCRDFSLVENQEHVDTIARSIAFGGGFDASKPIKVFLEGNKLFIEDGECRWRAVHRAINVYGAEITTVPIVNARKGQNDADRVAAQFVANSGKNFNEFEEAEGVRRLLGWNWDVAQIAQRTGLKATKVNRLIAVLELPEEIKALARDGKVSVTYAIEVFKDTGSTEKALSALNKGLDAAAAKGRAKVTKKHVEGAARFSRKAVTEALRGVVVDANEGERSVAVADGQVALVLTREQYAALAEAGLVTRDYL